MTTSVRGDISSGSKRMDLRAFIMQKLGKGWDEGTQQERLDCSFTGEHGKRLLYVTVI